MSNDANWYTPIFKSWQAQRLGPKPTAEQLAQVHKLNARPGKQALACAMALRDCGVTGAQIVMACGAPQLNKMRGFITDALLKREPVSSSAEGHTVYKLVVTAKGLQRIKQAEARATKAEAEGKLETAAEKTAKARPSKAARKAASDKATGKKRTTPLEKAAEASLSGDTDTAQVEPVTNAPSKAARKAARKAAVKAKAEAEAAPEAAQAAEVVPEQAAGNWLLGADKAE